MADQHQGAGGGSEDGLATVFQRDRPHGGLEMTAALSGLQQKLFGRAPRVLTLSRYVLLHKLGSGGGGVVYAAYDPELDRRVAIKLLRSRKDTGAEEELRARLQREAQAMAKLSHPNVIAVHDVGTYDEGALAVASTLGEGPEATPGQLEIPARGVFVVMELVDGANLKKWLADQPRSLVEILGVFTGAGRGLAAAHEGGLVHRDFKPTNVLIGKDGRVRVLDFGLARTVGDPEPSADTPQARDSGSTPSGQSLMLSTPLTEHGAVMGTPPYMSPEQHRAELADERSDQYSFCVALYEAVYGVLPFGAKKLDRLAELKQRGEIGPPPQDAKVPSWLRTIIARGLQPSAAARYPSMARLLSDLDRDPSARRRRLALGGVAVGLLAVVGIGIASAESQPPPCEDPQAQLAGVWDQQTRDLVRQAFAATKLPYASDTLRVVEQRLDAYTDGWGDGRTDACEATMVRGEQAPELMGTRMLCLDRQLEHVAALTRLFTQADAGVVESAVESVTALDPVEQCADPATQNGAVIPAEGPQRDELLAIERQIADAEAMYRAGRYADGKSVARQAVEAARNLGHGSSEARATLILGRLELGAGDAETAEGTLVSAWVAAERVADHQYATRALLELIRVVGYDRVRPDDAQKYIDLAEAKLAQRDLGDAIRALLLRNIATVRWRQGRYDETFPPLERARELYERALGADHPRVLEVMGSMGAMYAAKGQLQKSKEVLELALPQLDELLGSEHPTVAAVHQNLGATLVALGDHAGSVKHYEIALAIFERTVGPEHPSTGASLSNLGTTLFYEGRFEEAMGYFDRALRVKEATVGPDHVSVAATLNNLGAAESEVGNHERALELHERAYAIRTKALDAQHPEVAQSLTNMGWTLHMLGRDRKALARIDKAIAVFDKIDRRGNLLVEPLRARGEILVSLGRRQEGLADLERSVRLAGAGEATTLERADSKFALARALVTSDAARARELATSAADLYAAAVGRGKKAAEVQEWLRTQAQ